MAEDEASPYLTREQEAELIAIAQGDDREAASEAIGAIIQSNIPMLKWFAKKLRRIAVGLPYADRVSAAKIGMIQAIMTHDLSRGTKLSTASWYSVKRQLNDERHKEWAWFGESIHCLRSKKPKDPKIREHLQRFRSKARVGGLAALEAPDDHVDREPEIAEAIETVRCALATLSEREAMVMRARFGLDGQPRRSLVEIGEELGVNKERVRMIEEECLRKLRNSAVKKAPSFPQPKRRCRECERPTPDRSMAYCSADCRSRRRARLKLEGRRLLCFRCRKLLPDGQSRFCGQACKDARPGRPERFCRWCGNTLAYDRKACCTRECQKLFSRHQREARKKSAPIVPSNSKMELNSDSRPAMMIGRAGATPRNEEENR